MCQRSRSNRLQDGAETGTLTLHGALTCGMKQSLHPRTRDERQLHYMDFYEKLCSVKTSAYVRGHLRADDAATIW